MLNELKYFAIIAMCIFTATLFFYFHFISFHKSAFQNYFQLLSDKNCFGLLNV